MEAVQTGNLLFLRGMLPTDTPRGKIRWLLSAPSSMSMPVARAAHLAAINVFFAVARQRFGSDSTNLDQVVRFGMSLATSRDFRREHPKVAEVALPQLLQDVFGANKILAAWYTASQAFRWAPRRRTGGDLRGFP